MIKVLFICHGSICRSPMAEYVMRDMVAKRGLSDRIETASAATSSEELGNPIYPPAQRVLKEHGIDPSGHAARRMRPEDYRNYDRIIGMDNENMFYMKRMWPDDPEGKLSLLMDYTQRPGEVSDPWYTRDFNATWRDVVEGCEGLLEELLV